MALLPIADKSGSYGVGACAPPIADKSGSYGVGACAPLIADKSGSYGVGACAPLIADKSGSCGWQLGCAVGGTIASVLPCPLCSCESAHVLFFTCGGAASSHAAGAAGGTHR